MDLAYSKQDEAFRKTVRTWLKANLPKKDKTASDLPPNDPKRVQRAKDWQRKLCEAGYVALSWPKEYGGQGNPDIMRQTIVNEELVLARCLGASGSVRTKQNIQSENCAPEVQTFWPLTMNVSPTSSAQLRAPVWSGQPVFAG